MPDDDFKDGSLRFESGFVQTYKLDGNDWRDGYLAFSNQEKRFDIATDIDNLQRILAGQPGGFEGYEGLLVEVNLWSDPDEKTYRELSIERQGSGFFFQQWTLLTGETESNTSFEQSCYYRKVPTRSPRGIFVGKLESYEVICPEHRLHVFITCGG